MENKYHNASEGASLLGLVGYNRLSFFMACLSSRMPVTGIPPYNNIINFYKLVSKKLTFHFISMHLNYHRNSEQETAIIQITNCLIYCSSIVKKINLYTV